MAIPPSNRECDTGLATAMPRYVCLGEYEDAYKYDK